MADRQEFPDEFPHEISNCRRNDYIVIRGSSSDENSKSWPTRRDATIFIASIIKSAALCHSSLRAKGRKTRERGRGREKERERRERKIEGWIAGTGLWGWFRGMDTGLHGHGNGYSTIACNPISTDAIYPIYHTLLSGALSTPVPRPLDRLTLVLIEFAQRWPRSCAPLFARVRQCFSWLASTTRRDVRAPCARFALIRISRLWWRSVRARSTPPMDKRARPSQRNRKGFR